MFTQGGCLSASKFLPPLSSGCCHGRLRGGKQQAVTTLTFTGVTGISKAEPLAANKRLGGLKAEVVFRLIVHL